MATKVKKKCRFFLFVGSFLKFYDYICQRISVYKWLYSVYLLDC